MRQPLSPDTRLAALSDAEVVRTVARAHERDRYLAALLAPVEVRADLVALAAFAGELARIPASVSEPIVGEMRLQWWRDTIEAGLAAPPDEVTSGHPVARAIIAAARRHALPATDLHAVIDAQSARLEDEPFSGMAELDANLRAWDGGLFQLAWMMIEGAAGRGPPPPELASLGAVYGIARVLIEAPVEQMQGRALLPRDLRARHGAQLDVPAAPAVARAWHDMLAEVAAVTEQRFSTSRRSYRVASRPMRLAALPVALVRPYLSLSRRVEFTGSDVSDIGPLTRVWRLWTVHRLGDLAL